MSAPPLRKILFVDDEPDIQEVVGMALELTPGLEIKTCGSGREALEMAPAYRPDLVVLDVMMPEMDGPATLRAMRTLPGLAETPVIFMTAKAQPTEIARFKQAGAADVIAKPFDPMKLGERIAGIWERVRGRG